MCKTCGRVHAAPTGKKCPYREQDLAQANAEPATEQNDDSQTNLMLQIKAQLDNIASEVQILKEKDELRESSASEQGAVGGQCEQDNIGRGQEATTENEYLTPGSIRSDVRAMQRAAERIAQFRLEDSDEEDNGLFSLSRRNGKKSGAVMLASDIVKKRIDWPHMYVNRLTSGNRAPVPFKELRMEEFVYGFLTMLKAPKCPWDKEVMLEILRMMMEDSMDYAWESARSFFELFSIDVEQGTKSWANDKQIMDMRMLHSRTIFPDKKEVKEGKKATNDKTAPPNTRYCALYQIKNCGNGRDHPPFVHACAYCGRITGTLYRHPESDCFRKAADQAKNGQPRE